VQQMNGLAMGAPRLLASSRCPLMGNRRSALLIDIRRLRVVPRGLELPGRSYEFRREGHRSSLDSALARSRVANGAHVAKPVGAQRIRVSTARLICIALGFAAAVVATKVSRSMQMNDVDASPHATADTPQT
jgi:hypothetical protein